MPVINNLPVEMIPIIETGASEVVIVHAEAKRSNEPQFRSDGNARAANAVLLGALSTALAFPTEDWEQVIAEFVPPKTVGVNLEAFRRGRTWIAAARGNVSDARDLPAATPVASAQASVRLEITP